jgi:hypothetical protein
MVVGLEVCQIIRFQSVIGKTLWPLKPCQNKKGQSFVVMLGFSMSFLKFASAACCKKKHAKPSITTNAWLFLFCQSFS